VVAEAAPFLVPTSPVPVPSQIRSILGNDDEMSDAGCDGARTSRAHVRLFRLVRLDRVHDLVIEAGEIVGETLRRGVLGRRHGPMVRPRCVNPTTRWVDPISLRACPSFSPSRTSAPSGR